MPEKNVIPEFKLASLIDMDTLIEMMSAFYIYDHIVFNETAARNSLRDILENKLFGRVFLINLSEDVIGYIVITFGYSLEFHGRDAFIDEIYFKEEYRGKGFGKVTLEFAENICRENGIRALHLEVERSNTIAQAFYRKSRFEEHDRYLMTKWL